MSLSWNLLPNLTLDERERLSRLVRNAGGALDLGPLLNEERARDIDLFASQLARAASRALSSQPGDSRQTKGDGAVSD